MKYLLSIIFPPAALLMIGKPGQAILNLFFCFMFWLPGVIHALMTISADERKRETDRLIRAMKGEAEPVPGVNPALVTLLLLMTIGMATMAIVSFRGQATTISNGSSVKR